MRKLALVPMLWLTLSGATPQSDISPQALAECRATRDQALAAMPGLSVEGSAETELPNGRRTVRSLAMPTGFNVFRLVPYTFRNVDTTEGSEQRTLFMTLLKLPYPTVEAAVLEGHGFDKCPQVIKTAETSGGNCAVFIRQNEGYATVLMIQQYGDDIGIGCNYIRK